MDLHLKVLILVIVLGSVECNVGINVTHLENDTLQETKNNLSLDFETTILPTEMFTEMDVNSSTTAEDIELTTTSVTATEKTQIKYSEALPSSNFFCVCDLLVDTCDVNCCCDERCTDEDKKTFTDCGMTVEHYNEQYCFKENFIFINNTPYLMTEISPNLLCIYTDNSQPRFVYNEITPVTERKTFQILVSEHQEFSWIQPQQQPRLMDSILKVGSPIEIQFESGSRSYLSILKDVITGSCSNGSPVAFMIDAQNECYHRLNNLEVDCTRNIWLNAQFYFKNFKIIRMPATVNVSEDNLISVVPHLCVNAIGTSVKRCNFLNDSNEIPTPFYSFSTNVCESAVAEIFYHIFTNGSQGVVGAQVDITLGNIEKDSNWKQRQRVEFRQVDDSVNKSSESLFRASGNPGYLVGAPVLAGQIVSKYADTQDEIQMAVQLNSDPNKWLTIVDARQSTHCRDATKTTDRLPVTFKNDIQTGCILEVSLQNITDNTCALLQDAILDVLLGWNPPDVVGVYGNARPDQLSQWVTILHENKPPQSHLLNNFICTNIVRVLQVRILYANTGSLFFPQAKIVGAKFEFDTPTELKLFCGNRYCQSGSDELNQHFSIQTSVEFIDISNPAVATYAEPPVIHLQLPADFFYPFTSDVPNVCCNYFILLSLTFGLILRTLIN